MPEEIKVLLLNLGGLGTVIMLVLYFGPKLATYFKRDSLDRDVANAQIIMVDGMAESYAKKFRTQEDWQSKTDARLAEMDTKIHNYAVKVTRLTVVMLKLEALLEQNGIPIDQVLAEEVRVLKETP